MDSASPPRPSRCSASACASARVALVHHPAALETGWPAASARSLARAERSALRHTRRVVVTSASTNRSGSHARYYSFTLEQETEVTIGLESSEDTYLYLLEGAGRDGAVEAENDDIEAGVNTNSQIVAILPAGTYTVEAATYDEGAAGDFTLTITVPGSVTPPGTTPSPGPTGPQQPEPTDDDCVETFGTLAEAAEAEGEWTSDCTSTNRSGGYARFYTFRLEEETEVTIELTSEVDTYLFLLDGADKGAEFRTENDDIETGVNSNSRIVETLESGTYTVEATTYTSGQTGQFTLSITVPMETTEPPVSSEDPCVAALGTLTGAVTGNGSWSDDCASTNRSGSYARYYSFTLSQETEVQVDLTSDADTYLFLLEGVGRDGTVEAENDDIVSGNTNSQIIATLAAGAYTIEATTYEEGVTGEFTLSVVP